jgi:nitrite reductase/ring-hydroxylating ferredoxin subunit
MTAPPTDFPDPPESSESSPKDGRRAGAGVGPGLTRAAVYERSVRASGRSVWENVRDWEHLPWLHRAGFSSIECVDSGVWGWRARIGLQPAVEGREILLELVIEPDEPRYVSRTLEGPGAGSEIWTRVEERGEHETFIEVEFWLPGVEPGEGEALGEMFTTLYTQLWDEDEGMMIGRERELARRREGRSRDPEPLRLGSLREVEGRLPLLADFAGERFRVVEHDGSLVAHASVCPHRLGPLDESPLAEGRVVCPWHGYTFDVVTGRECRGRKLRLATAPRVEIDAHGEVWLIAT